MVYKKAYNSLKACPMKFAHPSEVEVLQGFGPKLVARLVKKMEEFCETNSLPKPKKPKKKRTISDAEEGAEGDENASPSPKKKARKLKPYVPGLRTGAYAIIMALSTLDEDSHGITKAEVIRLAQPHSNSSFTVPENAGKHYTAWSSMATLKDKQLVHERGRPSKRYILTEEGWDVAKRIKKTGDPSQGHMDTFIPSQRPAQNDDDEHDSDDFQDLAGSPIRPSAPSQITQASAAAASASVPDIIPQGPVVTNPSALPNFDPIVLESGSYRIELVVDKREVFGTKTRDYMEKNLTEKGVAPIMRELKLGDVLWVAKMNDPKLLERRGLEGDEVMLDYIVERKRLDDLVSSIKDGRFHEQKFRLRKSGVKNVVYLVEEITNRSDTINSMREAIATAITSSQVIDGYFVKQTQKMDDTIDYLVRMTKLLKQRYEHKALHLIPTNAITMSNYIPLVDHLKKNPSTDYYVTYDVFACLGSKSETLTLRDVYLKMLMCTKGLTGQKAIELQRKWKTPIDFIKAYREIEAKHGAGEEGKKRKWAMVSDVMDNPIPRKKITKALSTKIAEVWGDAFTAVPA